jgi:hypothetical protein
MIASRQSQARDNLWPCRTQLRLQLPRAHKCPLVVVILLIAVSAAAQGVAAHSTSFESTMQVARNPHQQMCSLLFQTPACTQPALWRKPAVPRPGASSCSQDTCSLSGPSPVQAAPPLPGSSQGSSRRRVKAAAQLASSTTSTSTQWWKKQSELWVDVHTEEQFYHEINSGDRLVFVGKCSTF